MGVVGESSGYDDASSWAPTPTTAHTIVPSPSTQNPPIHTSALLHDDLAESAEGSDESPPDERSHGRPSPDRGLSDEHSMESNVIGPVAEQEQASCDEESADVSSSLGTPRFTAVEQVQCPTTADTEHEDSDSPVLPRQRRLRRSRTLTPDPSKQMEPDVKMASLKRLQRGMKARRIATNRRLDVSRTVHEASAPTTVTTRADSSLPSSVPQPISKMHNRKRKAETPLHLETVVHERSRNQPTWTVDRIVGVVYENGELFYTVRWEDTLEPAENLIGCADTAIAEFRLRHLL
ncbi:hypothetical protein LTR37_015934 [Vermiconidia calcicola]|uniref:Uncharacterized protein n=1 Tax=Vermiconidia calcicola TaxID=1690605 RepID=A0ACC3MQ24_9PEZI|nr:hypothetical protein LTR37_015934 [Vermiconidia calcicola]